jgi:MFS family permease
VLIVDPWVWIGLRVVTGFCFAGLFMVIESWLNAVASNDVRGQLFSTYMLISLAAIMIGQMLLPLGDPAGFGLFAAIAIAITFALVPVSLTTSQAPTLMADVRLRLGHLYAVSPVGVSGCFLVGMANGSVGGLGAIYAQRLGFSLTEVALFMSAGVLGGALGQMPIGRLSDKVDRRKVLLGACVAAASAGVALAVIGGLGAGRGTVLGWDVPVLLVIVGYGVQGAFIFSMYGLCVAHTNDFAAPEDFVETSSGLLLIYGIGAIAGPVFAAFLMDRIGTGALFAWTASVHVALAAFTAYRMTRRARPEDRTDFVASGVVGHRTSPALAGLDPRAGEPAPAQPRGVPEPAAAQ